MPLRFSRSSAPAPPPRTTDLFLTTHLEVFTLWHFLTKLFPQDKDLHVGQFDIKQIGNVYTFTVPRKLTDDECYDLACRRGEMEDEDRFFARMARDMPSLLTAPPGRRPVVVPTTHGAPNPSTTSSADNAHPSCPVHQPLDSTSDHALPSYADLPPTPPTYEEAMRGHQPDSMPIEGWRYWRCRLGNCLVNTPSGLRCALEMRHGGRDGARLRNDVEREEGEGAGGLGGSYW